jgi:chemotaxis protein histidine kinase CheA
MALKKIKKAAPVKEVEELEDDLDLEETETEEIEETEEVEEEVTPKKSLKKVAKKSAPVEEEIESEDEEEDEVEDVEEEDEVEDEEEDVEEEVEEEPAPKAKKAAVKKSAPAKKAPAKKAPAKKEAAPAKKSAKKVFDPNTCIQVDGISEEVGEFGPDTFISKDSMIRLTKKVAAKRLSEFDENSVKEIATEVYKVIEEVFTAARQHATFKFGDTHFAMRFISGRSFSSIGDGVEMADRFSTKVDKLVVDLNAADLTEAQAAALEAGRAKYDEKHGGKAVAKKATKKIGKKK